MRKIEPSTAFRKDYKREMKGPHRATLERDLPEILRALAADQALPPRLRDHPLSGNWSGYRDLHVKPDLLLIYAKPDETTLSLVRLGSHSALFG